MPFVFPLSTPVRDLTIGRLRLPTVDTPLSEALGSQLTLSGEAVAVGQRRAKGFVLTMRVHATPGDVDLKLVGDRMRRQLRSLIQNHPYRLQGLYIQLALDPERNGWLMIGEAELSDDNGGVPFADYKLAISDAYLVATLNTHRDAYRAAIADRTIATNTIDTLELVLGGATFPITPALAVLPLPSGASSPAIGEQPAVPVTRTGRDGAIPLVTVADGDVVSWERSEAAFLTGDVVVHDRRGSSVIPDGVTVLPEDAGWEEVYGPAWPWTQAQADTPAIENSLCRVRYDASGLQGFRVDVWDGGGWAEQGKLTFLRGEQDASEYPLDALVDSGVVEYTADRAVIYAVMRNAANPLSRERVLITLQRGWTGPRVEMYAAAGADGTLTSVLTQVMFTAANSSDYDAVCAHMDVSNLAQVVDTGASNVFPGAGGTLAGENWVTLIRHAGYAVTLAVAQASTEFWANADTFAYGGFRNSVAVISPSGGYVGVHAGFYAQAADQVLQAEAIRNTGSSTTAVVSDVTAAGGSAVSDSQTSWAANTLAKAVTDLQLARYRLLARVKVSAGGVTGTFAWGVDTINSGAIRTTTSTSWVWVDLGGLTPSAAHTVLGVAGWVSAGSGQVLIDRVALVKLQSASARDGSRDHGGTALLDVQGQPRRVPRG